MSKPREILFEKLLDLLALETRASELYEMAIGLSGRSAERSALEALRREELEHISLVNELLNMAKLRSR